MSRIFALSFILLALSSGPSSAAIISVGGTGSSSINGEWDISLVSGGFLELRSTLEDQIWWGNESLARVFAGSLGDTFSTARGNGPDFAFFYGSLQVGVAFQLGPNSPASGTVVTSFPVAIPGRSDRDYESTFAIADKVPQSNGGSPLGSETQLASVLGAWTKSVQWGAENDNTDERWQSLQDCVNDSSCDIDAAYAQEQEIVKEGAKLLTETAVETGELNFDAVPVPTNKAEAILFAVKRGLDLLLNVFYGDAEGASVSDGAVEATEGTYSINPDFAFYEGYADIWLDNYIDDALLAGIWVNDYAGFSGFENYLGLYEVLEVDGDRVRVGFTQIESTAIAVPAPSAFSLLGLSFFLLGLARSKEIKQSRRTITLTRDCP